MIRLALLFSLALAGGCVSTAPIKIEPLPETELSLPRDDVDSIVMAGDEVLIYDQGELLGIISVMKVPNEQGTAIEALKKGFIEAAKGTSKPRLLSLPDDSYGFVADVNGSRTGFIAHERNQDYWFTISFEKSYFNKVMNSLSLPSSQ